MSLIQQQAKFWLKALIRIVDAINTQYSNETADLLKSGPFGAYGYLVGGDAGARKWSAIDGLMQGADAVGHTQEARNNVENMYAAQPTVPYTDQPANHIPPQTTPSEPFENEPPGDNTPPKSTTESAAIENDAPAKEIEISPENETNEKVQTKDEKIKNEADIGKKLRYPLGKATGNKHNIDRSKSMYRKLKSIGIFDNDAGNEYLKSKLKDAYTNSHGIVQPNGRIIRESILGGPNGALKMESIWDGNKLVTIYLYGPKLDYPKHSN